MTDEPGERSQELGERFADLFRATYLTFLGAHGLAPTVGRAAAAAAGNGARDQTDVQATVFSANGTVDSAFGNPPFSHTGAQFVGHERPSAVAVPPDGQIVIAGSHFEGTSVFGLARLDTNGSLDSGFGNAGVLTTSRAGPARRIVEVQAPWIVDEQPHSR